MRVSVKYERVAYYAHKLTVTSWQGSVCLRLIRRASAAAGATILNGGEGRSL